ncbi:probable serine/threonine-protein kinase PBL20 [Gossypium raimondii]|uniref:probable serine/threonine-protein kinase PBL20 n=1 Tax=Gossypium raimondii TaxID=29730 RepID=UPI00063B03E6|nr:probable serine/threonine-protein kinase PBL20 [Gossypium raimondii]
MKCFRSFKDKFRSQGQRSDPMLKGERKADGCSGPDRISKSSSACSAASPHNTPELYEAKSHNLRVFSFSDFREATCNFDLLHKVGKGGFRSIYKGTIKPADEPFEVAIKKLYNNDLQLRPVVSVLISTELLSYIAGITHELCSLKPFVITQYS